ncbi:MAG: AraC family transcriptional regulator [Rhizobiaceae bacterium]
MQRLPAEQTGWLAGARDPVVGAVLAVLHENPRHGWTLAELAREAGASRSVLARRFSQLIGETPVSYLRRWRLCLAAGRLATSRETILHIAADVGYQSEAAFNRAFRLEFGVPPARYRRRIQAGDP